MSKSGFTIVALAIAAAAGIARGAEIDEAAALAAANGFATRSAVGKAVLAGRSADSAVKRGGVWIVSLSPSGYIVLSASDRAEPVVTFAATDYEEPEDGSSFAAVLDAASLASDGLEADASAEPNPKWMKLLSPSGGKPKLYSAAISTDISDSGAAACETYIAPFVDVHWAQSNPWNDYTPLGCPCGCVATALSQELYFWKWPRRAEGTRTVSHKLQGHPNFTLRFDGGDVFHWDRLKAKYTASDLESRATRDAAAKVVMWAQSWSRMIFTSSGSGAVVPLYDRLPWYECGYSINPATSYTDAVAAVKTELADGAPVQVKISGHAIFGYGFASDGSTDYLYVNYGWGGGSDGWYNLAVTGTDDAIVKIDIGMRPEKTVQFREYPVESDASTVIEWDIPDYYTNRVAGFTVSVEKMNGAITSFTDDFKTQKGTIHNPNIIEVAREGDVEGLWGWNGGSGSYTWPDVFEFTEDSEISYNVGSDYMGSADVSIEAKFDDDGWVKVAAVPLVSDGWSHDYGTTTDCTVDLSAYAGRRGQLRIFQDHGGGGYPGGRNYGKFHMRNWRVSNVKVFESAGTAKTIDDPSARSLEMSSLGLAAGETYAIRLAPVMNANDTTDTPVVTQTLATAFVDSAPSLPEIVSLSSTPNKMETLEEGMFVEGWAGTNVWNVGTSSNVVKLEAFPSHLSIVGDDAISVSGGEGKWSVVIDAGGADAMWSGNKMIVTLKATDANGNSAYKDVGFRVRSGAAEMPLPCYTILESGETSTPMAFNSTTTIDGDGNALTFAAGTLSGSGYLALSNGTFTIENLDGFTGILEIDSSANVTLPADLSGFSGTLSLPADYTLTSTLGEGATVILGGTTYLNGAEVPGTIKGSADIYVASGTTKISSLDDYSGTVYVRGGTLEMAAGAEKNIWVYSGKLRLVLSEEQEAFGYSATSTIKSYPALGGSIVFVKADGTEVSASGSDGAYAYTGSAKVWKPSIDLDRWYENFSASPNYYATTARWTGGSLPANGEYAVFDVTSFDAPMDLNLASDTTLAGLKVTGGNTLYIVQETGGKTLTVERLINDTTVEISTSLIKPLAIDPGAKIVLNPGVAIDCELDFNKASYVQTYYKTNTLRSALPYSDIWQGTVFVTNAVSGLNPNNLGNASSKVRLCGWSGYFGDTSGGYTYNPAVELVDNGDTPALHWNNGYGNQTQTFKTLSGDGTFKTSLPSKGGGEKIVVNDISSFAGNIDLSSKTFAVGTTVNTNLTTGLLEINNGSSATIAPGKVWRTSGGTFLDGATASLDVKGTLATTRIVSLAANGALALSDGGKIIIDAIDTGSARINASLYAGTFTATADIEIPDGFCFSSTNGTFTTVDTAGHAITFASGAISGHGTIYPTSSDGSKGSATFADLGYFAGTIIIDDTTVVNLPDDLSEADATVAVSGCVFTREAGKEGKIEVRSGGTLRLVLSSMQTSEGYTAPSVTVLDGGTVEFVDESGDTLAVSDTDAVYSGYVNDKELDEVAITNVDSGSHDQATLDASVTYKLTIPARSGVPAGTLVRLDSIAFGIYSTASLAVHHIVVTGEDGEVASLAANGTGTKSNENFGDDSSAKRQVCEFAGDCILKVGAEYSLVFANSAGNAASQYFRMVKTGDAKTSPIVQSKTFPGGSYRVLQEVEYRKVHTATAGEDGTLDLSSFAPPLPSDPSGSFLRLAVSWTDGEGAAANAAYPGVLKIGEDGAVSLDPGGVVGGVTVRPEFDTAADETFAISGDGATLAIKAIAGLWYSVDWGDAIAEGEIGGSATGTTAAVQATATGTMLLSVPAGGETRFYRVKSSPSR